MIVIPMAGLSSRFKKAGYVKPKYMLEANGRTLFWHSLVSFRRYFNTEKFLFISLNVEGIKDFIVKECENLGIDNYDVEILNKPTGGQAETVYLGICNQPPTDGITIFNIDTFRPGFIYPKEFELKGIDGYLETFIGAGENWSNVVPLESGSNRVALTGEKQQLSEYCCTGLYYWKNTELFCRVFEEYRKIELSELQGKELYIAPMYNLVIKEGGDVRFSVIPKNEVIFCGVPEEYKDFINNTKQKGGSCGEQ
jgi:NDP-sugar pyrophosphorylase family protein